MASAGALYSKYRLRSDCDSVLDAVNFIVYHIRAIYHMKSGSAIYAQKTSGTSCFI